MALARGLLGAASVLSLLLVGALEISAGLSGLLVLSPVSGDAATAVELATEGSLARAWRWGGGVRLALGDGTPEAFGRLSLAPLTGAWRPAVGLELGVGRRAFADSGEALLSELREASREGMSPFHAAVHAAPLRFTVADRYQLSFLDLVLGTQLVPAGRVLRLQVGLVSAGIAL